MSPDLEVIKLLAEAVALGLLVGSERYRGRQPGEKKSAGVRTFVIVSLLGAICGLFAVPAYTTVTFAAVALLVGVGYYRSPSGSLGLTTEFAALLVFWIGYLLASREMVAIGLGIVLTIFLAAKRPLHDFVKQQISETEFEATLKFLAVVLVVYPVLPDREMGPFGFFNPRHVWGLVILVSTISYVGYFLMRWLGRRRGLMLASVVGGVVSTAAVTMSLAERSRVVPSASRLIGAVAVLANAVQGPRLLLLLWVVNRSLAEELAIPLLGMAAAGLAGGLVLGWRARSDLEVEFPLRNPYSLGPALKFGAFFVAILLLVGMAGRWLGEEGVLIAGGVAGLGSASAAALSVARLLATDSLSQPVAAGAVLIAIAANSLTKGILALLNGTRRMALWLTGGLATMLAAAALLLLLG
ncbi:MAG: DUF4010 domain-containing protein [Thermoanaerobaculia bacterium]|nr:DUF4010 domain-containing protein [Thermoanaerobaculia bacterium]